jgi:hypothetical protein
MSAFVMSSDGFEQLTDELAYYATGASSTSEPRLGSDLRQSVSVGARTCGVAEADLCEVVFKSPLAYSSVTVISPARWEMG